MNKFESLLSVASKLLGPEGCPWDRTQTFRSLQPYVLEEAHEVIEAVDTEDDKKIIEELGDLLYTIVFYAKLAEKEKRFVMDDVIEGVKEKLIRRHPHIFGDVHAETPEEVMRHWEKIKKAEKGHEARKTPFDGIPPTLPLLAKAQKVVSRMVRAGSSLFSHKDQLEHATEKEIGDALLDLILRAEHSHVDVESALRRTLRSLGDASSDSC